MLAECTHCGAPLDVKVGQNVTKCCYCGRKNMQQQMRLLAPQTPVGWTPPQMWTPPAHFAMPSHQTLKYHQRAIGMAVMLPIALGVIIPAIAAFASMGGGGWLKVAMWDEASTLTCSANEHLTIGDFDAKVKSGFVIVMSGNCQLTVSNAKLRGRGGIKGGGNARITLDNVDIETEEAAVEPGGNGKLYLRGKSKLRSETTAISGFANTTVEIDDSSVEGGEVAIDGGSNATVAVRGDSSVAGTEAALRVGSNADIELRGGTLSSKKGAAIEGQHNVKLRCRDAKISGATSLSLGFNAEVRLDDCNVKGERKLGRNANVTE
jgi:hypothetical protein